MEIRRKVLLEKLHELKEESKNVFNEINEIQLKIHHNTAEIEVLEKYYSFVEGTNCGSATFKKLEMIKGIKKKTPEQQEALIKFTLDLHKEVNQREKNLIEFKQENEEKTIEKEKLKIKAAELKEKIDDLKQEVENNKNKLLLHYHLLLREGKDTRNEGLVWIIKSIWNLGENVIMSYMPDYLDEICIDFLFSIAHKDYELYKMNEDLEITKQNLRNSINSFQKKGTLDYDPRESRLKFVIIYFNFQDENKFNIYKLMESMNKKTHTNQEVMNLMSKVTDYENALKYYKTEIEKQKKREINRINKEFLTNDYQRRFNITQHTLVSAIYGEEKMSSEYSKLIRDQKVKYVLFYYRYISIKLKCVKIIKMGYKKIQQEVQ